MSYIPTLVLRYHCSSVVQHMKDWGQAELLFLYHSEVFFRVWLRAFLYLRAYLVQYSGSTCSLCLRGLIAHLPQSWYKTQSCSSLSLSQTFLFLPQGALLALSCCSVCAWFPAALLSKPITAANHRHSALCTMGEVWCVAISRDGHSEVDALQ